jgi:2-C-methyl-D-erythritol 4-phosphate cytidylyltransferase
MAKVWSIVVAGGTGRRFGRFKQFALLGGRPIVQWAVEACRPFSDGVVLVVPAEAADDAEAEAAGGGVPQQSADTVVPGGPTRSESVRHGLAAVPADAEVVVVHDAARPLATPRLFDAVIAAVRDGGADGAVPGLPVNDTIKEVDGAQTVKATLERSALVAVQTPQAFSADVLRRAHERATALGILATDDAALVEALGATVRVVPGEPGNLKITTPEDLRAAEHLLGG